MPQNETRIEIGGQITGGQIKSVPHIVAEGAARERLVTICGAWVLCIVLAAGGIYASIQDVSKAKDLWVIIGPIISGVASALVTALLGKKGK
jgi:succinyl-CoA synthetase beta subunit